MYLEKLIGITTKINTMKNFNMTAINKNHLSIMIVFGFALALAFVGFIILSVDNPKPEWSDYWFVRPLLITPIIGGFGGASCYLINTVVIQNSFVKLLRILFSIIVFIFFIWIGTVLGLDGTLWN
jgi:hypothetical protein